MPLFTLPRSIHLVTTILSLLRLVTSDTSIIGGPVAPEHAYPFTVLLAAHGAPFCGGSLITPRHVLTAAHCIEWLPDPTQIIAGAGFHNWAKPEPLTQAVRVKSATAHPKYRGRHGNYHYDIAVLGLDRAVALSSHVGTICLAAPGFKLDKGDNVTAIGWGRTEDNGPMSEELRQASLAIVSHSECNKIWPLDPGQSQICTRDPKEAFCQGDSGGPIIWQGPGEGKPVLVGVPSYVDGGGCLSSRPSVSTRVAAFEGWVGEVVKAARADVCVVE